MAVAESTVAAHVQSFQEGDERGFNFFFREYYVALSLFAYRQIGRYDIAEEIAEDALIKLWQRRQGFTHPLAIRSFLYTAARFACLNFIRDRHREKRKANQFAYLCEEGQAPVLQQIIHVEVYKEALRAVGRLPTQCRRIFESLFITGKTPDEVAEEMGLSVSTIRNQKARALMLLRKQVDLSPFPYREISR